MLDSVPPKKPWENDQLYTIPSLPHEEVPGMPNQPIYPSSYGFPGLNNNPAYYPHGPGVHNIGGYYGPIRPALGSNMPILRNLESGTSTIMEHLQGVVNVVTGVAQFLDSTVYAGWSSINALGLVASNIKTLRDFLTGLISRTLKLLKLITVSDNASRILLIAAASSIPFALKMIIRTFKAEQAAVATVTHCYSSSEEGHLKLAVGDSVKIIYNDGEWVVGEDTSGKRGYFPSNYVNFTA